MPKRIVLFVAVVTPALGQAAVYQCKVDGQTVFSDRPCGDNAKEIEVDAPAVSGGGSMVSDRAREFMAGREKKERVQDIDRDIDRLEERIAQARENMDAALAQFQRKKAYASNNLAGATWEGALAEEADVLRQRYQSEIDGAYREIERLREQRRRILNED